MATKIPSMVDMSMDAEERQEFTTPVPPKYPYGLCLSLCEKELEKLGLENDDLECGDMLHLHCLAKVTSVSCSENESGEYCRVELQICYMTGVEDEEKENRSLETILYRK